MSLLPYLSERRIACSVAFPSLSTAGQHETATSLNKLLPRTQIDGWPFLVAGLASQRVFTASSAGVDTAPDLVSCLNRVVSVI